MGWFKKEPAADLEGMKEEALIAAAIVEEMNVKNFSSNKAIRILCAAIELLNMQKHGQLREMERRAIEREERR